MKRLVLALLVVMGLALVLAGLAVGLALRIPPAPEPAAEPEPAPRGIVDELAGLLGIDTGAAGTTYRLLERLATTGEAEVSPAELADITTTALSGTRNGREILAAAEPIRVRLDGERLEVATVVDLRDVRTDRLGPEVADVVKRIRRYAPFLADRAVFVALSSTPVARDGDLDLGEHAGFRIGSLPLPRALARVLGLDARLREALTVDLRLLELREVRVRTDHVYLRTTPGPAD